MAIPQVAIVGRPNVGKSSLFNWIAGRRIAIVDPTAGVTRDRLTTLVQIGERYFELVDTGGMGIQDVDNLTAEIEKQIQTAIEQAAVILFVVDAREGIAPLDEAVAAKLRYVTRPVVCVANKCDTAELENQTGEFYKFGRGKLINVIAMQNRGKKELLQLIAERLPESTEVPRQDVSLKLAIVGRRNTGKSTFINCLAESERMIVSEVAGTTRDSVDVRFEKDGKVIVAIDTAGVRKKKSIGTDVEFYSMARAERSVRRADVVLLFQDARDRISKVDKQLAEYVQEQYKPAIFVVNKWDLLRPLPTSKFGDYLRAMFPNLDYVPMAFITAKKNKNVQAVLNLAQNLHKQAVARVDTSDLNRVVRAALEQQAASDAQNRRPKIFYATQVDASPPTIVLFTNGPELFDKTYQRYLLKTFRDQLPFSEVPIKMYLRRKRSTDKEPDLIASPTAKANIRKNVDLSGLKFKSKVDDEDLKHKRNRYESELWKDL